MTRIRSSFGKLAALSAIAVGVLLATAADEANAQQRYSHSSSYRYSSGATWGSGPSGYYNHSYNNNSFRSRTRYSTPYGGYDSSRGGYRSTHRGSGYNYGSGTWGYRHRDGGGYNNFNRWGW